MYRSGIAEQGFGLKSVPCLKHRFQIWFQTENMLIFSVSNKTVINCHTMQQDMCSLFRVLVAPGKVLELFLKNFQDLESPGK